jgi:hypothetical protein
MSRAKVIFTLMPPRTMAYYDWLVTGLEILKEQNQIEIEYRGCWWDKILRCPKVVGAIWKYSVPLLDFVSPIDYVCLTGRVEVQDKVMNFAIDFADSPFSYSTGLLEAVDLYFKVQCPVRFDREGFPLAHRVRIPYHPEVFTFEQKIRPAMLGRPLGRSLKLKRNLNALRRWEAAVASPKDIRILASFGSAKSPPPRTPQTPLPAPYNFESEGTLLARWGERVHHPNKKRARVVEILNGFGKPGIEARLWRNNPNAKPIGDDDYMRAVGRALVNVNISGFRRSLPFRFMDTFLGCGAVATDTLAIRWYREFEKGVEIFDLGDLGYEPEEEVNWTKLNHTLEALYEKTTNFQQNAKDVRALYERKWAPSVFASHFLNECISVIEQRN